MFRILLIIGICTLSLSILGFWLLFGFESNIVDQSANNLAVNTDAKGEQSITPIQSGSVSSYSGALYSADRLISDQASRERGEGFYINSADSTRYSIAYLESQGVVTVLLLDSNLALARLLAEDQLRKILPYDDVVLCDMKISVYTNRYVFPDYDGRNFGLSFCSFSEVLR